MASRCIVSFLSVDGFKHEVQVEASSLYEAIAHALQVFNDHNCRPSNANTLEVEVRSSVIHRMPLQKVCQWANNGARSPSEALIKERLRDLLNGPVEAGQGRDL